MSGCGEDRSEGQGGFEPTASRTLDALIETISGVQGEWHFGIVAAIAMRNDTIWIVDRAEKNVSAVDLAGNLLYVFGREGDGPEEFRLPYALHASDDGSIWVLDSQRASVVRLSSSGDLLEIRQLPLAGTSFGVLQVGTDYAVVVPGPSSSEPLFIVQRDTTYTISFGGREPTSKVPWFSPGRVLIATAAADSILVADGQTGRIWAVRRTGNGYRTSELIVPRWLTFDAAKVREERIAALNLGSGTIQMSLYTDIGVAGSRAWLRPIGSEHLAVSIASTANSDTALVIPPDLVLTGLTDLVWTGDTVVAAYETELRLYSVPSD